MAFAGDAPRSPLQHPAHFVLIPLFSPGHIIPVCDMARVLASRGALVTLVLTPANLDRLQPFAALVSASSLPVRFASLPFPSSAAALPNHCQNVDQISPPELFFPFFRAMSLLREPLIHYLKAQTPPPTCLIADQFQPWALRVAGELSIPGLIFHGFSCFTLLAMRTIKDAGIYCAAEIGRDSKFLIPGLPMKIETTKAQAPTFFYEDVPGFEWMNDDAIAADAACRGLVLNTCWELEAEHIEFFQRLIGKKIYTIGPLPLANKDVQSKASRGHKPSVDEKECLKWLDTMPARSVVYVSFGSITHTLPTQLKEIGAGLEETGFGFIWVIKTAELAAEVEEWLQGFEARNKKKGMVIRGWAPQVAILGHGAVGGFVTHCGWNSVLEAVSAGVPMLTWPYFADQFLNEKEVVEVLGVGVPVGIEKSIMYPEAEAVLVSRAEVEKGVRRVMEGEEIRRRVLELGEKVRRAVEHAGSAFANLSSLIEFGSAKAVPHS